MAEDSLKIRLDQALMQQFESCCADAGMTAAEALTYFARKVVRENRIPAELAGEVPNKQTREAMEEAERLLADPSQTKAYASAEEMLADLLAEA